MKTLNHRLLTIEEFYRMEEIKMKFSELPKPGVKLLGEGEIVPVTKVLPDMSQKVLFQPSVLQATIRFIYRNRTPLFLMGFGVILLRYGFKRIIEERKERHRS